MAEPFLAEIRIVAFNFAPRGWALCDGQILSINQNQSLYSLLGTIYGGDGRTSFALPDLRGRTPLAAGTYAQGDKGGVETHALTPAEMPTHTHVLQHNNKDRIKPEPAGQVPGAALYSDNGYSPDGSSSMHPQTLGPVGGGQAHDNMQPYLALNFAIALRGLFPSRN